MRHAGQGVRGTEGGEEGWTDRKGSCARAAIGGYNQETRGPAGLLGARRNQDEVAHHPAPSITAMWMVLTELTVRKGQQLRAGPNLRSPLKAKFSPQRPTL